MTNLQYGDSVMCTDAHDNSRLSQYGIYTFSKYADPDKDGLHRIILVEFSNGPFWAKRFSLYKQVKKEGNKMKEFFGDMFGGAREFVKEHRNILYTVAFIALVDHFFLGGELRGRLKALVTRLLDTVTSKVDKIGQ